MLFYRSRIPYTLLAAIGSAIVTLLIIRRELNPVPARLHTFNTAFIGLILEALPFVLLGVIVSSLVQAFVTEQHIRLLTPRHPVAGILFGSLLGLIFPMCECGMIPVVRGLIRKGMPAYIGIVYIIAGPIINPIVISSTFAAFRPHPEMVYARMGLALIVALITGSVMYKVAARSPLRHDAAFLAQLESTVGHAASGRGGKLVAALGHASEEFFEMGRFLIIGAGLAAFIQTSIEPNVLAALASHTLLAHLLMIALAFLLSLCSTSDAFVAASLQHVFEPGALLAFLVFGPMVDVKSSIMLFSVFNTRVVLTLLSLLFLLVLVGSAAAEYLWPL